MTSLRASGIVHALADRERTFTLVIPAFTLSPGDRKAIVGRSGSGKTTAMNLLGLANTPQSADSLLLVGDDGTVVDVGPRAGDSAGNRMARLRADNFGYVLQTGMLMPFLSIGENVMLGQQLAGRVDRPFARDVLDALGVDAPWGTMPGALSVGQRQRVAIARALAAKPAFILADEPTAALDPVTAHNALGVCIDVAASLSAGVLIITHDAELARQFDFEIVEVGLAAEGNAVWATIDDGTAAAVAGPLQ
jgi:putative ABC transport system ATP-binding protein